MDTYGVDTFTLQGTQTEIDEAEAKKLNIWDAAGFEVLVVETLRYDRVQQSGQDVTVATIRVHLKRKS